MGAYGAVGILLGLLAILAPWLDGDHDNWGWWLVLGLLAVGTGALCLWVDKIERPNRLTR